MRLVGYELSEEDFLPRISEDNYEDVGSFNMIEYWENIREDYYQENKDDRKD